MHTEILDPHPDELLARVIRAVMLTWVALICLAMVAGGACGCATPRSVVLATDYESMPLVRCTLYRDKAQYLLEHPADAGPAGDAADD